MENMVKMVSMKKMKKTALFMASAVMGAAIFSGCGGPGGAASATTAGADAGDRKSTRLNSSHESEGYTSRMPSSA